MLPASLCLAVLVAPAVAVAVDEPDEAAVSRLNARGEQALEAGRTLEALGAYREAELILSRLPARRVDRARALFLVGHCLETLGRPREALAAFRESLALEPPEALTARLARRLARLADSVDGHLILECSKPATVEIEGVEGVPRCGVPHALSPGRYRARITAEDGGSVSLALSIEAGEVLPVRVGFPDASPPDALDPGIGDRPHGIDATLDDAGSVAPSRVPVLAWSATIVTAGLLVGAGVAEWSARDAADAYEDAHGRFVAALMGPDGMAPAVDSRGDALAARARFDAASTWRTGLLVASAATAGLATWAWLDRRSIQLSPTAGGLAVIGAW